VCFQYLSISVVHLEVASVMSSLFGVIDSIRDLISERVPRDRHSRAAIATAALPGYYIADVPFRAPTYKRVIPK
jgi:hypothetical protein